jgi:SAM-dependent methyltransferase
MMNDVSDIGRYLAMEREAYASLVAQSNYATDAFEHLDAGEFVVGSYAQHQAFDYERWLLGGVSINRGALALEYGCGPGRMLRRLAGHFERVDGADISPDVLEVARRQCGQLSVQPRLILTDGQGLPSSVADVYDVAFSVICLQHICVHAIRRSILESLFRALKPGGLLTLQMGYGPGHGAMVDYYDHFVDAPGTNGKADVSVLHPGEIGADLAAIGFESQAYALTPTGPGDMHGAWIFVRALKPGTPRARIATRREEWTTKGFEPLAVDSAATERARRLHRQLGVLNRCRDQEERLERSSDQLHLVTSELDTCRASLTSAVSAATSAHGQLLRLRAADCQRVRRLVDDLVRTATNDNLRIGIFGAGAHTEWLFRETTLSTAPSLAMFDSNPGVWGEVVEGIAVQPVSSMTTAGLDAIIVSSLACQDEMTTHVASLHLPGARLVRCYP